MNDYQNAPTLRPIEPIPKLKYNEIGVRSDLKGFQIKNLIDKIIFFLIYKKYPSVTLKSRGKGTPKLISIIDILQRKILGLYVKQVTYSTSYINSKDPNKEIKLPCMDSILTLKEKNPNEGFIPPKKIEDLEFNFIDPKNPPDFRSIRGNNYNNNNYNNNINNNYNNNRRGRGRGRGRVRIINRGNKRGFRPGFRGRGNFYNRGNRGRGFRGGFKNNNFNNFNNNNNFSEPNRERGRRTFNRHNVMKYNNERKEDEDYREFKGINYTNKNNNNNFNWGNNNNNFNKNNNFNHNTNNNFKNENKTQNNFYQTPHFVNQPINNNNLNNNNNIIRNNPYNNNQINQNKMNMNSNINNKNINENNNTNLVRPNSSSNVPLRGRGTVPTLRGRGQVMQLLGRGMPMRGKMSSSENENKMENQKGL